MTRSPKQVAELRLRRGSDRPRIQVHWPAADRSAALLVFLTNGQRDVPLHELCMDPGLLVLRAYCAGIHDALAVTEWVADHVAELGGDTGRLFVAGEQSGGRLALAAALHARDCRWPVFHALILVDPRLGRGVGTADSSRARLSVGTFAGIAPTTIVTTGNSDGRQLADRLRSARVDVTEIGMHAPPPDALLTATRRAISAVIVGNADFRE